MTDIDDSKVRPCPLCGGHTSSHPFDEYVIIRCGRCGFSSTEGLQKWNAMPRVAELQEQLRFAESVAERFIQEVPPYFVSPILKALINMWREVQSKYDIEKDKE